MTNTKLVVILFPDELDKSQMGDNLRSWKDIPRNPYTMPLDARMLTREGLSIAKRVRLKGDLTEHPYVVNYDSEFVISFLRKYLIERMPTLTQYDWEILMSRALLPTEKDEITPFYSELSISNEEN